MKKILLSMLAAGFYTLSSAQWCPTGADEDFTSTTDQTNLYPWGGTPASNLDRTTGKLTFTIDQAQGAYEPFGISFGDDGGTPPVPNTIDLSGDATFSATLTNNASYDVTFRMAPQDINNVTVDTYAAGVSQPFSDAWMYAIQVNVPAGGSATISGTFAGGAYANYGTSSFDACDLTQIKGINFTIIQTANTGAPSYQPLAIVGQTFALDDVSIGSCTVGSVNLAAANIASSKLYPNPVSDLANIELNLKSASDVKVTVSDMMGKEVAVVANGNYTTLNETINVANFSKGIYTVNYFVNGAPAKSEMMVVK
jgi:hypothetical protein